MPDGHVDLTLTSPPYDNLRTYNGYSFDFESIAKELYRVTKPNGMVVWIVGDAVLNGSESGSSFKQALYFMSLGFKLHDTMIYEKNSPAYPARADSNRYTQIFEYMFVFSKGKPKTFNPIMKKNVTAGAVRHSRKFRTADGEMKPGFNGKPINEYGIENKKLYSPRALRCFGRQFMAQDSKDYFNFYAFVTKYVEGKIAAYKAMMNPPDIS